MPTFGVELRRLRRDAGISLSELARRVHYSKSHLSKVENGRTRPNKVLAALCDQELRTGGVLAALMPQRPARSRRNVLLVIQNRVPSTEYAPTHPAVGDLRLVMLLGIPEIATECAEPCVYTACAVLAHCATTPRRESSPGDGLEVHWLAIDEGIGCLPPGGVVLVRHHLAQASVRRTTIGYKPRSSRVSGEDQADSTAGRDHPEWTPTAK